MTHASRTDRSDYMNFAKLHTGATWSLSSSGVLDCVMADIDPRPEDYVLHGPNPYGWPPLMQAMAARFGVSTDCLAMPGGGASFTNHLAMAALISPGDEALIEDPAYELMVSALGFLGADVKRFQRRREDGFVLDVDRVIDALGPRTRLVVLTDLHNPTGVPAGEAAVRAIAAAVDKVGGYVLIDEIYRELEADETGAPTAFRPDGNIVITSSLTKAYGLSGLRCGWILARPDLAERMRRLNDLFGSLPAHVCETLALRALDHLPKLRARANALLAANRAAYDEILADCPRLLPSPVTAGTTRFPRLLGSEDGDALYHRLVRDFDACVTPGRFFGDPQAIRIGLAGDPAKSREAMIRLRAALGA